MNEAVTSLFSSATLEIFGNLVKYNGNELEQLLSEKVEVLSRQDLISFSESICSILNPILIDASSESISKQETINALLGVVIILKAILKSKCERLKIFSKILHILSSLLDYCRSIEITQVDNLKNSISLICESYIVNQGINYEILVPNTIIYLLIEALKPGSKDQAVKRLFIIRHNLEVLDFSTSNSSFNRELLLKCFVHPTFLKCSEGHKFLSKIICMAEGYLFDDIFRIIKIQSLQGSKTISQVYGEVLYRSWKDMGETQDDIDNSTSFLSILSENIQDLIHNAVHCVDAKYFKGLRWVVQAFHDVKRSIKFDDYLVALFEPILWRSLKCANALVRAQSTIIFLDVFPLQQSSTSTEQSDLFLQKQFDQLTSLLKDTDHRVRSPAIVGVSHIIKEYWDILPAATITNLLRFLFESLAFDSSHPNVRLSVLTGINELLDQPLSHLTLRNLLPIIKNLLNDKSEKVRDGFVKMLLKVKNIRALHFYDIVSVDDLLQRLLVDQNHDDIATGICELLMPSFFPISNPSDMTTNRQTTTNDHVQRCLQLIENNFLAAEIFYRNIVHFAPIGSVAKLSVILFQLVNTNLEGISSDPTVEKSKGKRKRDQKNAKSSDVTTVSVAHEDKVILAGILTVINALLQSMKSELPQQAPSKELITKYFTPVALANFTMLLDKIFPRNLLITMTNLEIVNSILSIIAIESGNQTKTFLKSIEPVAEVIDLSYICRLLETHIAQRKTKVFEKLLFVFEDTIRSLGLQLELIKVLKSGYDAYSSRLTDTNLKILYFCSILLESIISSTCSPDVCDSISKKMIVEIEALFTAVKSWISIYLTDEGGDNAPNNLHLTTSLQLMKVMHSWNLFKESSKQLLATNTDESSNPSIEDYNWTFDYEFGQESLQDVTKAEFLMDLLSLSLDCFSDGMYLFGKDFYSPFLSKFLQIISAPTIINLATKSVSIPNKVSTKFSKLQGTLEKFRDRIGEEQFDTLVAGAQDFRKTISTSH